MVLALGYGNLILLMNYNLCRNIFFICLILFLPLAESSTISSAKKMLSKEKTSQYISIPYTNHEIINNYKIYKRQFSKKLCGPKVESNFWEIYKKYKAQGYYLPLLPSGSLDKKTISKYQREMRSKSLWLGDEINLLHNRKSSHFKISLLKVKKLKQKLKELVDLKSKFMISLAKPLRKKITKESNQKLKVFTKDVISLFKRESYLLSYNYPLDHLKLRTKYDRYKQRKDLQGKRLANDVYFYRQIVQDGTIKADGIGGDRSVRAVIDTITLSLSHKGANFITENNRFDLVYLLDKYEKFLKFGKKRLIKSLSNWKQRNIKKEKFYNGLLNTDKKNKDRVKDLLLKKGLTRYELKDYVLKKEAESFYFWHSKEEIFRALFAIETILFGEVGDFEGYRQSERSDIVRVILGRSQMDEYSQILDDNMITPYLKKKFNNKDYLKYRWLNLLFKEGEFSFSYYFLSGNLRIYCPSMTRKAKSLEKVNTAIALKVLRRFNGDFKGIRYFSRASMHGRIDMSTLWKRFKSIPERLGAKVSYHRKLLKLYKKGLYENLYSFKSTDGLPYRVIKIKNINYVIPYGKIIFYHHRNPHYFKYFIQK